MILGQVPPPTPAVARAVRLLGCSTNHGVTDAVLVVFFFFSFFPSNFSLWSPNRVIKLYTFTSALYMNLK